MPAISLTGLKETCWNWMEWINEVAPRIVVAGRKGYSRRLRR